MMIRNSDGSEHGQCDEDFGTDIPCGELYDTREDPDAGDMTCGVCRRKRIWWDAERKARQCT